MVRSNACVCRGYHLNHAARTRGADRISIGVAGVQRVQAGNFAEEPWPVFGKEPLMVVMQIYAYTRGDRAFLPQYLYSGRGYRCCRRNQNSIYIPLAVSPNNA